MLKRVQMTAPVVLLASCLGVCVAESNDHAHFGQIYMNDSNFGATLKLDCKSIVCDGEINGRYVLLDKLDGKINFIKVVYNERRFDRTWVEGPPVSLKEALRENSFENTHYRPTFGVVTNDRGEVLSFVDKDNRIVYEQNPDDEAKGITTVAYVQKDAPVLKRAKSTDQLDKKIAAIWHELLEEPKNTAVKP